MRVILAVRAYRAIVRLRARRFTAARIHDTILTNNTDDHLQ
jgi:hypothetical protein